MPRLSSMVHLQSSVVRDPAVLFCKPKVQVTRRANGSILVRSPYALGPYPQCLGEYLLLWAHRSPQRLFLLERGRRGSWRGIT